MTERRERPPVGWREWVRLPELGIAWVKAKVDTGARTSALHAFDVERVRKRGGEFVRFKVHPLQKNTQLTVTCEAPLLEERHVKSSSGCLQVRPVVLTSLVVNGETCPIELTLTSRDEMGFRMLLGRQAVRGRFVVDPGRSFLGGTPPRTVTTRKKKARRPGR